MEIFFEKLADPRLVKTSESLQVVTSFQVFRSKFCAYLNRYSPRSPSFETASNLLIPQLFVKN